MILLTELVAVKRDVASQSGHPGNKARSEFPEQDRPGEVEFDLLEPLLTVPVQLGGVGEVVVVQTLSLVNIWGMIMRIILLLITILQTLSPSLSGGSSAMLQNSMLILRLDVLSTD